MKAESHPLELHNVRILKMEPLKDSLHIPAYRVHMKTKLKLRRDYLTSLQSCYENQTESKPFNLKKKSF